MSDKYKMIKELGLNVGRRNELSVNADDLEALLAKGVRVTRQDLPLADCWKWGEHNSQNRSETHTALLVDIKPIQKIEPVSKEELIEALGNFKARNSTGKIEKLIERIEKAGIK